jgi:hypothetical protein
MIGDEFVADFVKESRELVEEMIGILELAEEGLSQVRSLEKYGQLVDRIMGGAKSLAVNMTEGAEMVNKVADYAAVCKAVGYKASQIRENESFFTICVALLLDVTDGMAELLNYIEKKKNVDLKDVVSDTLVERLKWASAQFSKDYRETVEVKKTDGPKMNQTDIDALMAKLGLD